MTTLTRARVRPLPAKERLTYRQLRFMGLRKLLDTLPPESKILDVGGTMEWWREMDYFERPVTLLNRFVQDNLHWRFTAMVGDAKSLPDGRWDLVICHQVLGHLGHFIDQLVAAHEIQRVGTRLWVATPNHWFPIDWATRWPLVHWLPDRLHARFLAWLRGVPLCRGITEMERTRNMTRTELKIIFPSSYIKAERCCGLVKAWIITDWE